MQQRVIWSVGGAYIAVRTGVDNVGLQDFKS